MKHRGIAGLLASAAFAALFAWVAAVTASRAAALATGRTPLDGAGERRFMSWSYRDPRLMDRLLAAGRRLPPGEPVLAVCTPRCDTSWYWTMAAYGLSRQAVVGAKTEGDVGPLFPVRIERSARDLRILPRSGPGRDGAR